MFHSALESQMSFQLLGSLLFVRHIVSPLDSLPWYLIVNPESNVSLIMLSRAYLIVKSFFF